jgi:hypothetical protein
MPLGGRGVERGAIPPHHIRKQSCAASNLRIQVSKHYQHVVGWDLGDLLLKLVIEGLFEGER